MPLCLEVSAYLAIISFFFGQTEADQLVNTSLLLLVRTLRDL